MKYNDNGTYKDIYVKTFDTLPVGTEVDYDGQTVPTGWTEVDAEPIYSTTEQVCGTWIDGKPLYRKVLQDTVTSIANTDVTKNIDIGVSDIDKITKIYGEIFFNITNGLQYQPLFYASENEYFRYWINYTTSNKQINSRIKIGLGTEVNLVYVIEYTKTTD